MRRGQERERSQALEEAGRGVVSFFFLTRADPLTRAEGQKGAGEAYVRWGRGRRRSGAGESGLVGEHVLCTGVCGWGNACSVRVS